MIRYYPKSFPLEGFLERTPLKSMLTDCPTNDTWKGAKFWVPQSRSLTSQKQLSSWWVFVCFKPCLVELTTNFNYFHSPSGELCAEHTSEVMTTPHATCFLTLSIDDHQMLITMLISPSTCSSAKCNPVWKPPANLPDSLVNLTGAPK